MQDIIELDEAMTYLRDRAILWFLESAPFRRATLTKLLWKDLKSTEAMLKGLREEAKLPAYKAAQSILDKFQLSIWS